jgi:hypothetical protein
MRSPVRAHHKGGSPGPLHVTGAAGQGTRSASATATLRAAVAPGGRHHDSMLRSGAFASFRVEPDAASCPPAPAPRWDQPPTLAEVPVGLGLGLLLTPPAYGGRHEWSVDPYSALAFIATVTVHRAAPVTDLISRATVATRSSFVNHALLEKPSRPQCPGVGTCRQHRFGATGRVSSRRLRLSCGSAIHHRRRFVHGPAPLPHINLVESLDAPAGGQFQC